MTTQQPLPSREELDARSLAPVPYPDDVDRFDPRDRDQMELLKRTVVGDQNLTDDEFALFIRVAQHTGLDPFRRQIYAIRRKGKMTIQTGIDGYRAIAVRSGVHAGTDDAVFHGVSKNKQFPGSATVTVYKLVGGIRVPFTATARWDEYKPPAGQDQMWEKMPHNQLAKCAEALALRKAFPEETAGVVAEEAYIDVDARTIAPADVPETREEALERRFRDLPVAAKVAFTAALREQEPPISPPGQRDDDDLDRLEVLLDGVAGPEPETCQFCDAPAVRDGLCDEHQPPPEDALHEFGEFDGPLDGTEPL